MERVNARRLGARDLPERCRLIVVDVSFISLLKVVPALLPHLEPGGWLLPLIKPQFEAGRAEVGKGGVVRDEEVRRRVVEVRAREIAALGAAGGLELIGAFDSPVAGAEGNRETFALYRSPPSPSIPLPPRGGRGTAPSDPSVNDPLPPGDAAR
jgi:23S rRNA (cytidine1920-2'-O)/16S rRNA (cytidine1409-2'-O)-methyltransferase